MSIFNALGEGLKQTTKREMGYFGAGVIAGDIIGETIAPGRRIIGGTAKLANKTLDWANKQAVKRGKIVCNQGDEEVCTDEGDCGDTRPAGKGKKTVG